MAAWDKDPIVQPKAAGGKPWEKDPIAKPGGEMTAQPNLSFVPGFGPALHAMGYDGIPKAPADGYKPSSMPILDPISTFANRAVEAVPVIGKPIADFGRGLEEKLYGEQPGTRQKIETGNAAQFPAAATAGDITGTVAPFIAGGALPIGARLLGMTGSTMARVGAGSVSAGTIEFLDSLSRGEDAGKALQDAGWAAGAGAAFPLVQKVAGMVVKAVTGKALEPAEAALAKALEADGIKLEDIAQKMEQLGPEAVLADLGPNLQRLTGSLASLPGPAQKMVRQALGLRADGINRRVQSGADDILGPAKSPASVEAELKAGKKALSPEYTNALANADSGDLSGVAANIEDAILQEKGAARTALESVRDMMNFTAPAADGLAAQTILDPNPSGWLKTRQAIDGMLEGQTDSNVVRVLTDARRQIDDALAAHVPGIKTVDAKYAELAKQGEAFETGQKALDSGRTAMWPQELADKVATASGGQRQRLSEGARSEIERIIGTTTNNLNALKTALKGEGSWNRERLAALFGPEKADKLLNVLEREKTFDATNRVVTQNSETAARTAMQREVEHVDPQVSGTTLTGLLLSGGQKLANTGARFRRSGTNSQIAEALIGRGQFSDQRYKAISDALMERGRKSALSPAAISQLLMSGGF
jgi:hypothetical protein